jgi:hypothetical protein
MISYEVTQASSGTVEGFKDGEAGSLVIVPLPAPFDLQVNHFDVGHDIRHDQNDSFLVFLFHFLASLEQLGLEAELRKGPVVHLQAVADLIQDIE